jgi:hypothetical protein
MNSMQRPFTWQFILQILSISHLVQAVVNQIDMRNVPGYNLQPACSQDCLYCCHDVAWQSSCFSNECFCDAASFNDRLRYVEYCAWTQCQGNISAIESATSIVKNYCTNSLWTTAFGFDPAAATTPTAPPEITVPATFTFQGGAVALTSSMASQAGIGGNSLTGVASIPTVYLGGTGTQPATVTKTVVAGTGDASQLGFNRWETWGRCVVGLIVTMIWSSFMS